MQEQDPKAMEAFEQFYERHYKLALYGITGFCEDTNVGRLAAD